MKLIIIHSAVCIATGPQHLPKRVLPRVLSSAFSFSFQYPLVSGKGLAKKSNNAVVFPLAFHIAVQQPYEPLWSRLLLYDHEPSRALFVQCSKSLLSASEFLSEFPSPRTSLFGSYLLVMSCLGDPTCSNATASLVLRGTGTHRPFHHGTST
jgi:hypothetical protein